MRNSLLLSFVFVGLASCGGDSGDEDPAGISAFTIENASSFTIMSECDVSEFDSCRESPTAPGNSLEVLFIGVIGGTPPSPEGFPEEIKVFYMEGESYTEAYSISAEEWDLNVQSASLHEYKFVVTDQTLFEEE